MAPFLELNAWINSSGAGDDSWVRADARLDRIFTRDHYVKSARIAHRGVFSNIFLSDRPQLLISETTRPEQTFDPAILLASVLAEVPDIGGIVTASTTYNDPYTLARQIQSLNLLTQGRIGWNLVTSWHPAIAANFSDQGLPNRAERYARAQEFIDVVLALWDSWQFPWGQSEGGHYGTPTPINHKGDYFSVAGPLNLPAAPWGRPKIVQAGGSSDGIALAGRYADYVYAASGSLEGSRTFRAALHSTARSFGRVDTDLPRLMPAISPVLFSSEAALTQWKHDQAAQNPATEAEIENLKRLLGVQGAHFDADRPLQPSDFGDISQSVIPIGAVRAKQSRAVDGGLSLRALAQADKQAGLLGTPETIAAHILQWWHGGAADGFTISALRLHEDLEAFVDQVVPLLQKAGVYRTDYGQRDTQDSLSA